MEFQKYNEVSPEKAKEVLDAFPIGTVIESTIGHGGGTEVFIGDSMLIQPFSYLDDYDITHFRKVKEE